MTDEPAGAVVRSVKSPDGPQVGPYGEKWIDAGGRWRIRLTAEGRELVAGLLAEHPIMLKLLKHAWPGLYKAAKAAGFSDDEINSGCLEGIVRGAIRYDPGRSGAKLSTAVAWWVRGGVSEAVRVRNRSDREIPTEYPDPGFAAGGTKDPEGDYDAGDLIGRAELTDREAAVVRRRFGLGGGEPATLAAVAGELGVSKERARQLEEAAIDKLRVLVGRGRVADERRERRARAAVPRLLAALAAGPLTAAALRDATGVPIHLVRAAVKLLEAEGRVRVRRTSSGRGGRLPDRVSLRTRARRAAAVPG